MVTFRGHSAHQILALRFLMRIHEVQSAQRQTTHYSRIKRIIRREIAAIPVTMLTNVMRNFNDVCKNIEGRHLLGKIFYNYCLYYQ